MSCTELDSSQTAKDKLLSLSIQLVSVEWVNAEVHLMVPKGLEEVWTPIFTK